MTLTERDTRVGRHEAAHVAAIWILWGADAIGPVKRRPDGTGATSFTIPDWRSERISAFEAVIICLAAMEDGSTQLGASDFDVAMASRYAEVAALHVSPEERADEVIDFMIRGRRRAAELVKEPRFIRIREALEQALDRRAELSALQVREILTEAQNGMEND